MSSIKFNSTFEYKLIYIFRINDKQHAGCLKIGDATIHTDKPYPSFAPNCHDLNYAARKRIDSYTATAAINYDLIHTEIAVYHKDGKVKAFRDYKVHDVLVRSGIKKKTFEFNKKPNEWFECDLNTAKNAIAAVKAGKTALNSSQITNNKNPIIFRPEQKEAIKKTIFRYKTDNRMLWNAKMRFGKTLTALEVAKEMEFKKTIIITHRPVVSEGWFEDFGKIFYDKPNYAFGSKKDGHKSIKELEKAGLYFVYFASMQDLRGSDAVGGNFDKNDDVFKTNWDFVVVDEAHEGTQTQLGKNVLEAVIKPNDEYKTHVLELSGTPFNLLTDFEQESIYTWDYIMEQEAKTLWDQNHFGDSNPYEELPKMNIFTYHLEKSLPVYIDVMDKAFNFREFFRIWTGDIEKDGKKVPNGVKVGDFVHEQDVKAFLDLICKKSDETNYPYSTDEYRDYFRHSLWVVPGVKEAKALEKLIKNHHILKEFAVVNVAGDGGEEIDTSDALKALKEKMTDHPEDTRTITLSCGRLTTGVTVPEWTAVLMLAGTYSTAASQYLQTIFRVQSPANINGKIKTECFVFDFAPDRTLKMVAESVQLSARAGANNSVAELSLSKFLNYCPVIAIEDSNMKEYKVAELLQELKKAYAERVARNGFDDPKIYNDELLKLTEVELKEFENLKKIVGASKQTKKAGDIDINKEGFNEEETEEEKKLKEKKKKQELTEEEKKRLAELKEKKKNRDSAISILRAISIRMPLLVYGMDIDIEADVTIDNFADLVDDTSWKEFMPTGVDKDTFKKFSKYYDKDIFVAASRRIRYIAKTADELEPTERVKKIASLFATFKNPDKETVLTPWRVVNMHMSDTIGGYDFFDESHNNMIEDPRFVEQIDVTNKVFNKDSKILEINSKTGLYPLYVTYSLYREAIKNLGDISFDKKVEYWDNTIKNQVFVICKTPMAKHITKRTLLGYRNGKTNMHSFDDLVMQLKDKQAQFIQKVLKPSFWNLGGNGQMKFNAIVGNPPYQEQSASTSEINGMAPSKSIFQYFQMAADATSNGYVSLIYPGVRWIHRSGKGMEEFGLAQINDKKMVKLDFYPHSKDIFSQVDIVDGICMVLKNVNKKESGFDYYYHIDGLIKHSFINNPGERLIALNPDDDSILLKVENISAKYKYDFVSNSVLARSLFGIESDFVEKNPDKVRLYKNGDFIDQNKDVKLLANDKAGTSGRSTWFVTSKTNIKSGINYINKWKVVVSSANAGGQKRDNQIEILDNLSVFGRSRVALKTFETKDEAINFYNFCNTYLIRWLFLMSSEALTSLAKKVPDIIDYTNNNSIFDNNKDLNQEIFNLFGLSDDEKEYVFVRINEIDEARGFKKVFIKK